MKKFALALILIPLLSCQEKHNPINQQVDFSDMQLDLELFKDGLVFANLTDKNSLKSSLILLCKEVDLMRAENPDIETATFLLSKKGEKVLLDGYFTVSDKGEVIDSHNRSDSNTVESPTGYTKIGSCSNSGDKAMCIGDILHTYLSESLSGLQDCAATSVSVGMTSTTVYGKAC